MAVLECPICHKTVPFVSGDEVPFRPFCSERCKLVDLGRWLSGEYRISEEIGDSPRQTAADEPDIDDL